MFNKEFSTLSTGQFQRALLAWVLANKPKVLVLDDPMAGIDIGGEEKIYNLLHQFWKEWKLTMLIVTHDVHVIWEHANNVLCLNKQLIDYGPPKNVISPERLKEIYGVGAKWYEHKHAV
jgi:ABC-type Mn2+/Zn2+ transport system ATPase subunit